MDVEDADDDVGLEVVEDGEVLELVEEVLETVEDVELLDDEDDVKVLDDEELEGDGVPELALELPRDKKDDDVADGQGVDVGHGVDVLEGVLHIVVFEME